MRWRDFLISWAIGTVIFVFGRTYNFSYFEIFVMAMLAGAIQGAVTGLIRTRGAK